MGFLDHSTNNIIVDAVLTAEGRAKLAAGNLVISSYSFFDTEVDYSIIKKYGVVVGKEKIEKNTAILEASTSLGAYRTTLFTNTNNDGIEDVVVSTSGNGNVASSGSTTITVKNDTTSNLSFTIEFDTSLFSTPGPQTLTVQNSASNSIEITDLGESWSTTVIKVTRDDTGAAYYLTLESSSPT